MWRIEATVDAAGSPYDRRAALYDWLVRSPVYNRLAWSTSPHDYTRFAAAAIGSSNGPLLEVAAGSAAATAELHAHSRRPTVLVDLSAAMLERAAQRIAACAGDPQVPAHIRLVQADLFALTFPPQSFTTVLGLGCTHLFDDLPAVVTTLQGQLVPDGTLHLSGLVSENRRGRRYLQLLHRAGEAARPKSARELRILLGQPAHFHTIGCMAYATLPAAAR
ncbi:MAG: class I SAM-dependent methyltransferase [Actinomycetota bacterium]|nr:class I SAM-dependent methyltransferase [Actinomycetota bacterium]